MKGYYFTVVLSGSGETPQEAWLDAIGGFYEDPGTPPGGVEVEEDDRQ